MPDDFTREEQFRILLQYVSLLRLWEGLGSYPSNADTSEEAHVGPKRSVMAKRRKFSEEFKREAVGLTRQPGASVTQVAQDIGVRPNLLWRWRRQLESGSKAFPGSGVARDQEMLALKRELAKVKRERDFLRDAAAFFASESK